MAWRVDRSVARAEEGNLRQGRMTSHRRIFLSGAVAAALSAGMPTLAAASSLLSGYGGPGQGSQAILGSTLLGGSSGGGGSTGSSSGSFRYGEQPGGTESSVTSSASAGGSSGRKSTGGDNSGLAGSGGVSDGGASTYPASSAGRANEAGAVAPETLGLSGEDLPYILLAFAGLAMTGVLTRQLARTGGLEDDNR